MDLEGALASPLRLLGLRRTLSGILGITGPIWSQPKFLMPPTVIVWV